MLPQFFLRTKLLPPRLGRRVLARPRLIDRCRSLLDRPATIVCANAGCGKTTLITDFVRSSGLPSVWYQIDPSDLDLAVFFGYLIYGLRSLKADFGQVVLGFISETEDLSSKTDQLVDVFVNEVSEQIEQKTVLVLDDYHHVDSSEPIAAALDRLVQYLPDVLHIVLTTRSMPNLSVTRLRSKGLIGVIDRQDLLFTPQEVQQLFAEMAGVPVDDEMVRQFHERTHGWATGLQLIAQALEHRLEIAPNKRLAEPALLEALKQSEEEIFDYFAEEVLEYETPETQDALLKLALFKHIDPASAGCVLPTEEAYQILGSFQRRNLFISHVEGGGVDEYSFHPMFRRFLLRRLKAKIGEEGVRRLDREFADQLMKLGRWERAGLLYAEARDTEAIAGIMSQRGRELLDAGLYEIVKRGYDAVSTSVSNLHPEIPRLRAHIARMEGDLDLAERLFTRAAEGAHTLGDDRCEASALHGLASVYLQRGQHARAYKLSSEALTRAPANDLVLQAQCEHTLGNCQFLSGIATGAFDEAIETWKRGVELAHRAGNQRLARIISQNMGLPYAFTGDFARAHEWFAQLVEGDHVPFPQQTLAYCNLAREDLIGGLFDSCERKIEKAMEICRLFNLTIERGEAHEILGNLHRDRGQFNLARGHYQKAEDLYRDSGIQVEARELPDEQVRLLLAEKNYSRAVAQAERVMERRASLGYVVPLARSKALVGRAQLESAAADPRALISEALAQFTFCRANLWVARCQFLLARAEADYGGEERAAERLGEALRLAREMGYGYLAKVEAERAPALFRMGRARGVEADYLAGLGLGEAEVEAAQLKTKAAGASTSGIDDLSVSPPKRLARIEGYVEEREFDLEINLLGAVEVLREQGRPLAPDAWTLSRALKILCFIASRQNHRATKDAIIETFWPDTALEDIDKNFWPTISYIRRALNSNQEVKKNFIRYREGAYYLNPEFSYLIDTEEFERLITLARASRREGNGEAFTATAHRAIELYRGDMLEELYENWIEEPRAYYRNLYFVTLKELADHHYRAQEYEQSIAYCKTILARDPYREDVHRELMEAYARVGNRAALREQYENLKTLLMEELGVAPLPETMATYRKLTGQRREG